MRQRSQHPSSADLHRDTLVSPTEPAAALRHPVLLVGAGPGDPELLTLKAVRAIAQADVLLVDELVDRRVLAHAQPGARVIEVGKRGGCPSTPQRFIEALMVREARAGHRVVRLKGGDPMVFGRAAEEIDALLEAGLEVQVVPGVSAALGAAAAARLSLTDRRVAQGVVFVTGHAQPGGREPDWTALARSGLTLVVYMGLQRAAGVAVALIGGGLSPQTPALCMRGATRADESRELTTLAGLAAPASSCIRGLADRAGAPGLLVIGDVVAGWARAQATAVPADGSTQQAHQERDQTCALDAA